MADVFVSYKRENAAHVRKLAAALRIAGLDVWWDEDIPASAPWEATIEKELANAKAVIVCWSPDAVASENVRSEARVAREDGRLIQIFLRPCSPPLFFGERQGIDLSGWRGKPDDPRIAKIADAVRDLAVGKKSSRSETPTRRLRFDARICAVVAVVLLLAGSVAGWWLLRPAKAAGPPILAVLPFRALSPADANLVDAIWDDTRGAISRNPNLRVLGREAVKALADKGLDPAEYRHRVGADYLLDGSVEHVGDQVQMKLSLVRTGDGAEVWSDQVGGKLDNVFGFQQRVASEVEGRVRGRVAPGGGARAQNIATTGEVYAIFADARVGLRKRNGRGAKDAIPLLRKALAIDPNYAPAWAELGIATRLWRAGKPIDQAIAEAVSYEKRALTLAPNLAKAHAALAMVQGLPPELEPELRRAIALDPNDAEAWMWLGNLCNNQHRSRDALGTYNRTLEIDPLFWPAIGNKLNVLRQLRDEKGQLDELRRIEATRDRALVLKVRGTIADFNGRLGDQVRILLQLRREFPDEASWVDVRIGSSLMALGYIDEGLKTLGFPPEVARDYAGTPDPPQLIRASYKRPVDFWLDDDAPALFARLLPKHGRLAEYVGYYRAAFKSPDDFAAAFPNRPLQYLMLVPNVAANLRMGGEDAQADQLLVNADSLLASKLHEAPADDAGLHVYLAQLRAVQGRDDEAVRALAIAVTGWLPDRRFYAIDIADEPCFSRLVNRRDFQAIRQQILARIEEERRKVPLDLLRQAYPRPMKAAA